MIKKSRLRWFGHVERKVDNDWVRRMTWEVKGITHTGRPKKTWWDCVKNDIQACPKMMCSSGINGEGKLMDNPLTQVHLENGH